MNGARTIFRRKGYLLTALAAAVLLAASSGTAYAQRVSIGFVGTSGEVSETAFLDVNSLTEPLTVTVRVSGLLSGSRRVGDVARSLGAVTITPNKNVFIGRVDSSGDYIGADGATADTAAPDNDADLVEIALGAPFVIHNDRFEHSDEVVLVVSQSVDGAGDGNWVGESVELHLDVNPNPVLLTQGTATPATVSPDVFTVMVEESHVAPVAKFLQPDFTLSEQSDRTVQLDVASAIRGVDIPTAAQTAFDDDMISIRVANHSLVKIGACPLAPPLQDADYNVRLFAIDIATGAGWAETTGGFRNTGVLQTIADINALADATAAGTTADFEITGCGDGAGIQDPYITLTIMETNLVGTGSPFSTNGTFSIGPPLMISIDSDEAAPTLSFSPTDVEIDEGGMTSTVLLAEGLAMIRFSGRFPLS